MVAQHIGILGLGALSTQHYITLLNRKYQGTHGSGTTCPFLLVNTDFGKINQHLPDQFNKITEEVKPYLQSLDIIGIQNLLIPNITIHETIDMIMEHTDYRFQIVHPLKLMVSRLLKEGISDVILLGTKYTMNAGYICGYFKRHGIGCEYISTDIQEEIDLLRKKVFNGEAIDITAEEKKMSTYFGRNKNVVVACTELSIMFSAFKDIIYFDMAKVQIEVALKY